MKTLILFLAPLLLLGTTVRRDTLDNGIVVLTVEAHKIPVIEMRAFVRAGSVYDPVGKEGLANIVGSMLLRGTARRSANEIAESIEAVGGVLSSFCREDYVGLTGKVLSKDLALLVDLLSDCLCSPGFDSSEFTRVKRETVSEIMAMVDDPFEVSNREFRRLVFRDHRLAHMPAGYDTTVRILARSDVQEYYAQRFTPNNTFLVFVGDFQKDSLLALLNDKFGNWSRKELVLDEPAEPVEYQKTVGRIVPMKISQAYILLGHLGPSYGAADWLPARLMNYVLGASSMSRIYRMVRSEKGLAYVAYSYFNRYQNGGYFAAEVQTKKDLATEAVITLLDAMRFAQDSMGIGEIVRARNFYTGYFPLTHDSYSEMANLVTQIESEGLGLDYIDRFADNVAEVNLEQMIEAARKYLKPDRYCLLIVGDLKPEDIAVDGIEWME
ncbi:MAG: insulinase family protein [candidate division WOR-3 bacterium]|nr:MAG: insulinase family protein [candidate division WOR-3 bacterium]